MQSIVATLLIAGCAYSISASAGNVQIQVLDRDGKPVPEAVVVLYPSAATAATAPSLLQASPTIEQERMRFVPALTVVAPGTTLRFTNQDRWDHHVRGTPVGPAATGGAGGNEGFEMRLAGKQDGQAAQAAETTVRQPGVLLLGCHLHGSMRGHVFVTDSAWTLKTDADGIARFASVPDRGQQQALLAQLGVVVIPDALGDYEHNAALLIFDAQGRMVRIFDLAEQQLALNYARHLASKAS